ncbi:hypothetical protein LZ554_005680 [Drepanopeziza brunnea f. sp. 'monogermtubi']|nr:hypothetical protein LZ554_005680 [Drepanopeziza brunnea f. sp. 'monogermtubi']
MKVLRLFQLRLNRPVCNRVIESSCRLRQGKIPPVRTILRIAPRRPEPDRQGDSSGTLLPEQNEAGYPTTSGKTFETLELIRKLNESATSAARDKSELGVTGQTLKLIRKLNKPASLVGQDIGDIAHPGRKRRNQAAYVESDEETSTYEIFHAVEVEPEDPAGEIREISEARDVDSGD